MDTAKSSELQRAYQEWLDTPTRTIHLHARDPRPGFPSEMDVHIFEDTQATPFVYLATAGLSAQPLPGAPQRIELVLVAAGRFGAELEPMARRLGELTMRPYRDSRPLTPNMVLGDVSFPVFTRMSSVLLADFNIQSADYLPSLNPPVRILRVTPLFEEEAVIAQNIGDLELYHRFQVEGINHEDPRRPRAALAEPESTTIPPPAPSDSIASIWSDIEDWLSANARPTLEALRPGADEQSLNRLEQAVGLALPPDYRAALAHHDGRAYLTDYEYLSVNQIFNIWSRKRQAFDQKLFTGRDIRQKGGGIIRNFWWHPGWIPFAEDSGGNLLCIDMAPGWRGKRGQILRWEREEGPLPSPEKSFHEWLLKYRDDLLAERRFEVDDDGLMRIKA